MRGDEKRDESSKGGGKKICSFAKKKSGEWDMKGDE